MRSAGLEIIRSQTDATAAFLAFRAVVSRGAAVARIVLIFFLRINAHRTANFLLVRTCTGSVLAGTCLSAAGMIRITGIIGKAAT